MRKIDFDGRLAISQMSVYDRIVAITWRCFYTHDVVKSKRSIFDRIYAT